MVKYQKITIDGQPIPEGYILNKWFEKRFGDNGNVLLIVVGKTGSGKSWSCIKICEDWYKYKFNKLFPEENICFSLGQTAKRIKKGGIEKQEFVIVEEAGVIANALDFQNKIVKLFNFVLQSARCKNTGFIFNLPTMGLLNKTARSLAHGIFQTTALDRVRGEVTLKPFYLQTNPIYGKTYQKYLRQRINGKVVSIKRIKIKMPSMEIIKPYEIRKMEFVEEKIEDLEEETDEVNNKKNKVVIPEKINPLWVAIKDLYESGVENQVQMGKILGIAQGRISKHMHLMAEKGYFYPKYLEKSNAYLLSRGLATVSI